MKPKSSLIWLYFTEVDIDHAKCKICNKIYSRKGRTTTSLKLHLKSLHKEQFEELDEKKDTEKLDTSNMSTISLSQAENRNVTLKNNITLQDPLDINQIWNPSHTNTTEIDRKIGEMIALQNLPCSFVEGIGFRHLMDTLLPNYELRDSHYFTNHVVDEIYAKMARKIEIFLAQFTKLSFAVDIWSEPGVSVSLLCFTTYGITDDFRRMQFVLECCFIPHSYTDDIISDHCTMILQGCNVQDDKVHCFIQPNISQEINSSNISSIRCTIHQLHLCIRAALEQQKIKGIIDKCRQISAHFIESPTSREELYEIQREQLNQPALPIIDDSDSRWSSTYHMIKRILEIKDAIHLYNRNHSIPQIVPEEWSLLNKILEILTLFEEITSTFSDTKTIISSVIPIIYALKLALHKQKEKADTTQEISNLITNIIEDLCSRFCDLENNNVFVLATYLDPRYKLKFFNEIVKRNIESELLRLLPLYHNTHVRSNSYNKIKSDNSGPSASKRIKVDRSIVKEEPGVSHQAEISASSLMSNLDKMLSVFDSDDDEGNESNSLGTQIIKWKSLIKDYNKEKRLRVTEDPLEWWKINTKYRDFAPIVRAYLSPPAGAAPNEKHCYEANQVDNSLKSLFEREKSVNLLFIKYNLPLLNFEY